MTPIKSLMKWIRIKDQDDLNGRCIMMEGLFNTLGHDIIGTTTIMPLFLTFLGANLQLIGVFSSMQSVLGAITPLLFGGIVAAAQSKRRFSIVLNGLSRGSILLITLGLLLKLPPAVELALFFAVMAFFSLCQPITGLSWNYLLGDCVNPANRGALLGTLYALSGVITFLSSAIIKGIRSSALAESGQYAAIFMLGGVLMFCSVLFYLPLKEKVHPASQKGKADVVAYVKALAACYMNPLFRRTLFANIFSSMSIAVNAFFFIFAQNVLKLTNDQISNLIIVQTFGLMIGGLITGRISKHFGIKRMLQTVEGLGLLVPIMGLASSRGALPFLCAAVGVFVIGFTKSGLIGYQAYILEIVPTEKSVYHIVARSLALLPFSFASVLIGQLITSYTNTPVFVLQIALALIAFIGASRLRLNLFNQEKTGTATQEG